MLRVCCHYSQYLYYFFARKVFVAFPLLGLSLQQVVRDPGDLPLGLQRRLTSPNIDISRIVKC